jgi:putative protease
MPASPKLLSPKLLSPKLLAPELLSPAGDRDCLRAAIENGADAVYFGLDRGFNARARATNFCLDQLAEVMDELHGRGVRGYVTFNTLVFANELAEAERTLVQLANAGVDAILVQDLGLARLAAKVCPDLSLHASTQMTLTSAECIEVASELNIDRVVLPREATIDEIRRIHAESSMELEAFVHGALCVAYSGQCLTSESLGGRSANRGQCAQACRLPYDLICDGQDVDLGDVKYLLSPQDLAAYDLVPSMLEAGVCSFKIEGRLKTPEYVANMTRHYRHAIDEAVQGARAEFSAQDVLEMELSFSRGFSPGWLNGCDHKMLVPGLSSAKRGVLIGRVTAIRRDVIEVETSVPLLAGDGIVFAGDREAGAERADAEQGGRVFSINRNGAPQSEAATGFLELRMVRGRVDSGQLHVGQSVWKTDDPRLTKQLRKSFTGRPQRKIPLDIHVVAQAGEPLTIVATTVGGAKFSGVSEEPLPIARQHVVDVAYLQKQLGRLGNSAFELRHVTLDVEGKPMAPASMLAKLRHELIASLDDQLLARPERSVSSGSLDLIRQQLTGQQLGGQQRVVDSGATDTEPQLRVLCRSLDQLRELIDLGVDDIIADFADIREYGQAAEVASAANVALFLAPPRIQKAGEMGIFMAMQKNTERGAGILARNLSGLRYFGERGTPVDADFSLNAANDLTVAQLREWGARRVTSSYDLNRDQLLELLAHAELPSLEVVVHQHMPMFHMEHCVYCAVMSPGTNKTNCGRPCDDHRVQLRDRVGMEHPLTADVGCRNTLFNATPQSAAEVVARLLTSGIRHFRIELLWDEPQAVQRVVGLYRRLLGGEIDGADVWAQLKASNRVGVTRGTLEERRDPLAIL